MKRDDPAKSDLVRLAVALALGLTIFELAKAVVYDIVGPAIAIVGALAYFLFIHPGRARPRNRGTDRVDLSARPVLPLSASRMVASDLVAGHVVLRHGMRIAVFCRRRAFATRVVRLGI